MSQYAPMAKEDYSVLAWTLSINVVGWGLFAIVFSCPLWAAIAFAITGGPFLLCVPARWWLGLGVLVAGIAATATAVLVHL